MKLWVFCVGLVAVLIVESLAVLEILRYCARKRLDRETREMFRHVRQYWKD